MTEDQIDQMQAGPELDDLLKECGLYDGEGSPSTDEDLALRIYNSEIPLISGGNSLFSAGSAKIEHIGGRYTGRMRNDAHDISAEGDTYALMMSRLLAKYCLESDKLNAA